MAVRLMAAEKLPVDAFTRHSSYAGVQISPDGKYLAFISDVGATKPGRPSIFFSEIATGKSAKVESPQEEGFYEAGTPTGFTWVTDRRIVYATSGGGAIGVDRDGKNWTKLTGLNNFNNNSTIYASEIIHVFDDANARVLMLQRDFTGDHQKYPSVIEVNTLRGGTALVANNVGDIDGWIPDRAGQVRIGVRWDGRRSRMIYRQKDEAPWENIPEFGIGKQGGYPLAFDYDGHTVYVASLTEAGTWGIYSYDLTTRRLGQLICADPVYDVHSPHDFYNRSALIFSAKKRKLIGVRYATELTRTVWLDEDMAQVQATLDHALPGVVNTIINWSRDENKILAISWSDRQPGDYYLLDKESRQLRKILTSAPWLKPELVPATLPLKFKSRDGLMVHGYLTTPVGVEAKNLPLVMLPHGGPWVRDTLEYDGLVKFIASRGYAVLQVNYRGSPGYGEAFSEAGRRQIGKALQNDITDGRAWAVRAGIADPNRVAIVGASYGGYSTLWALTNTPDLYRCGVSIAGVSDWLSIIKQRDRSSDTRDAYRYWQDQIGDPETDEAVLADISPINHLDRLKVPVFVVQGEVDKIVPPDQAHRLIAELKRRGLPYEEMFRGDEGHTLFGPKNRIELFKRIEAFLTKNMAPQ